MLPAGELLTRFDSGGDGIDVGHALKRLDALAHSYCVIAGEIGLLLKHLLRQQLEHVDYEEMGGDLYFVGMSVSCRVRKGLF